MKMTVSQEQAQVPVTLLKIEGDLDGSNYQELIARAKELYQAGARHLLLDMSGIPYMGSSGLVALHSIALLLQGQEPPNPEEGWRAFRATSQGPGPGMHQYLKLLNPPPQVDRVLQKSGLKTFFACFTELPAALASF